VARNPHVQGGLATPPPQLDDEPDEPDEQAGPVDDTSGDDAGDDSADVRQPRTRTSWGGGGSVVDGGAGWVLGLLLWGWVGLPFMKGGPAQVKKVWLAKFFNKAPDGSQLP
jgi:hypothetical protein